MKNDVPGLYSDRYLTDLLFEQAGDIRELSEQCGEERERAERFDQAFASMQWWISHLPRAESLALPVPVILTMLQDAVRYGQTGYDAPWIDNAIREMS